MIRDYWVYQKRDVSVPWALYIVKEYEKGKRKVGECMFDVTVYHEGIDNDMHAKSVVGLHGNTFAMLVNEFECFLTEHVEWTNEDHEQLESSLLDILSS